MKNLFLGVIAVLFISVSGNAMNSVENDIYPNSEMMSEIFGIGITVRFGHGADCEKRRGLCFIKAEADVLASAVFTGGSENGKLFFVVSAQNLVAINNHFHENSIVMEAPCEIDSQLVQELGLTSNVINAGTYQVVYNEELQRNEIWF